MLAWLRMVGGVELLGVVCVAVYVCHMVRDTWHGTRGKQGRRTPPSL